MLQSPFMLLFSDEVLFDRHLLARKMPDATALVMISHFGGSTQSWVDAYRQILKDWESYWVDLNLDAEDSVEQWREGRWRVARALFRLTNRPLPGEDDIPLHLDKLPREIGQNCQVWHPGAPEGLRGLADLGVKLGLLSPSLAAPLLWGMFSAAGLEELVDVVLGPDELGQVGLDGLYWERLEALAQAEPGYCLLVHPNRQPPIKAPTLLPPSDLARLPNLASRFEGL
ncbi:MAG: HAD family hydrolase [Anaerolineae bacterium]|nr:HAD family hydrolase [Anaerolineae bacterium]